MPYKYQILTEHNLIYVQAFEPVTIEETEDLFAKILADKLFDPTQRMLVNGTDIITAFPIDDARKMGTQLGSYGINNIVIVVSKDIVFGTGRLISAYAGNTGIDITVVRNLKAGKQLLDIENVFLPYFD